MLKKTMVLSSSLVWAIVGMVPTSGQDAGLQSVIARAAALELDTAYNPPPGDAQFHHASGFAKTLCSAVFLTGLDPEFAAENVGFFTCPLEERGAMTWVVDRQRREVKVTLPNGQVRTAIHLGDLGCMTLPADGKIHFNPPSISSQLPDPATTPWPMGDQLPSTELAAEIDAELLEQAIEAAFQPADGMTAAFVITHRGKIIGERYAPGISMHTPLESWSMGKSITATLMGVLIQDGDYALDQPAPIPQWQTAEDPRRNIRIADLLHMSSGLRFRAPQDPDFDPDDGYPDHLYVYTGGVNTFQWTAERALQWPPNTVGRYRNSDPVLVNYLIRLAVEGRGEDYHSFPRRALFDQLGIRNMVLETDPYGNFLLQGYDLGSARDWSRLGNLYLQDGVWQGKRILPEGYVEFVSTLAPAWLADGRPIYGGFFWINGESEWPIPKDAYFMAGAGGQYNFIIPSQDLVVTRLGHYAGSNVGRESLKKSLALLLQAVPES
ncbi:MAG: beta-lactamase family protein [bacterium]|nr:beta-lactamase family protein [bacterium]